MSIGPLLNVEQFQRFMAVIKKLGDRVEKEHNQFLRDSQRIEDRSATATNGPADGLTSRGGMDFATLVSGAGAATIKADTELNGDWEDDVWGSILSSGPEPSPSIPQPSYVPSVSAPPQSTQSLPSSPHIGSSLSAQLPRTTTTTTMTSSRINAGSGSSALRPAGMIPTPPLAPSTFTSVPSRVTSLPAPPQNPQPNYQGSLFASQQSSSLPSHRSSLSKPNYNISLSDVVASSSQQPGPLMPAPLTAPSSQININPLQRSAGGALSPPAVPAAFAPRQGMLTPLTPQRASLSAAGSNKPTSKDILNDFDPLA